MKKKIVKKNENLIHTYLRTCENENKKLISYSFSL